LARLLWAWHCIWRQPVESTFIEYIDPSRSLCSHVSKIQTLFSFVRGCWCIHFLENHTLTIIGLHILVSLITLIYSRNVTASLFCFWSLPDKFSKYSTLDRIFFKGKHLRDGRCFDAYFLSVYKCNKKQKLVMLWRLENLLQEKPVFTISSNTDVNFLYTGLAEEWHWVFHNQSFGGYRFEGRNYSCKSNVHKLLDFVKEAKTIKLNQ